MGRTGIAGEDGSAVEYIFARTSGSAPSSPSNGWGFDEPVSPWSDGAPSLTATINTLWRCERDIEGSPGVGDTVDDDWSTSRVVGRYGDDGDDGTDGSDGGIGPRGATGATGQDGDDGDDGQDGQDGQDAPNITGWLDRIAFTGVNTSVTRTRAGLLVGQTLREARFISNITYSQGAIGSDGSRSGTISFNYTGWFIIDRG